MRKFGLRIIREVTEVKEQHQNFNCADDTGYVKPGFTNFPPKLPLNQWH
jgi:hypothetical protein